MQSHSSVSTAASLTENYISEVMARHHRSVALEFYARAQQAPTVQKILEWLRHAITAYRMIPAHLRTVDDYQQCINLQSTLVICPLFTVAKGLEKSDEIISSEQLFKFAVAEHTKCIDLINTLSLECPSLTVYFAQQKVIYLQEYIESVNKCVVNLKQLMQNTIGLLNRSLSSDYDISFHHIDCAIADALRLATFLTDLETFEDAHENICQFLQAMAISLSPFAKNAYANLDNCLIAYNYHAAVISLLKKIPNTHQNANDTLLMYQHAEAIADLATLHIPMIHTPAMQIQIDTNVISGLYTNGIYAQTSRPRAVNTVGVIASLGAVTVIQRNRMN
jgi:hypothetical protein